MKTIGIMGGTFNPIHIGHLTIAQTALCELKLDKIWFMPAGDPPHKDGIILCKKHRLEMVQAAIEGNDDFSLFTYETDKERISYSAYTMTELEELYPEINFYFIMGADSFLQFEAWFHPEIICQHTKLVVADRNHVSEEELLEKKKQYEKKFGAEIIFVKTPQIEISSKDIRSSIKENMKTIRYKVPEKVYQYILDNNLYR